MILKMYYFGYPSSPSHFLSGESMCPKKAEIISFVCFLRVLLDIQWMVSFYFSLRSNLDL